MKSHAVKMERKEDFLEQLRERFGRASIAILTDYRGDGSGMTVKEISELRKKLRAVGGEYRVVKNTLAAKAIAELGIEGLETHLTGPTAIAFGYDDPASVAKAVIDFATDSKIKGTPVLRSGVMDGKVLDKANVKALADLPSLPALQTQILGLMLSSHRNILGVLNAPGRQVVQLLEAYRAKQEEEGGSSAPAAGDDGGSSAPAATEDGDSSAAAEPEADGTPSAEQDAGAPDTDAEQSQGE